MTGQTTKGFSKMEAWRPGLLRLPILRVKQINLCGCGLAALEMVLRHYGADVTQLDFLNSDRRLRERVERENPRGLNEVTIGILALKRGFEVKVYGEKLRASKTFFKLGGKMIRGRTDKQLILDLLLKGVPPIIKLPSAREAYGEEAERIPHYVVVRGIDPDGLLEVADPWYDTTLSRDYWKRWSSSIIAVERKMSTTACG